MKFLILNTDYPAFLQWLYGQQPELRKSGFETQLQARNQSLFGVGDFYSRNLRKLGHEALELHVNNPDMQNAWMREFGNGIPRSGRFKMINRFLKSILGYSKNDPPSWFYETLSSQIQYYRPDVILNQDILNISISFLKEMKSFCHLLVGQHASPPFDQTQDFREYDLMISSFPPTLEFFQRIGIPTAKNHLAFEDSILQEVPKSSKHYDVTFIGNFLSGFHDSRRELLEFLCDRFENINVWGPDPHQLPPNSSILSRYRGPLWGREAYKVIAASKIVLNHHADAGPYANNMRLYEVTGMGSMLLTDSKQNLSELFAPGKEVATFSDPQESANAIEYYLKHEEERETIAAQGQARTLKEHTYTLRMKQLEEIILRYI